MKLICFTGIDGTGKTTLARSLVKELNGRGIPATYVYGRTYPILSRLLMALGRALILRGNDPWRDYPSYAAAKRRPASNPWLRLAYATSISVDYHAQLSLKLLPHVGQSRVVVLDRYVYDTMISDLAVHLSLTDSDVARGIDLLFRYFPRPAVTFLLDAPEETAFSRKTDVPHVEYLRERRRYYLALSERPEVEALDGSAAISEVLARATDHAVGLMKADGRRE